MAIGVWLINRGYNKEVNAAKQRRNFLLSITHELKSPLASIRLILETLRKRKLTQEQSEKRWFHGRGASGIYESCQSRVRRYLSGIREGTGPLHVVDLPDECPREKHRMEDRLLVRILGTT